MTQQEEFARELILRMYDIMGEGVAKNKNMGGGGSMKFSPKSAYSFLKDSIAAEILRETCKGCLFLLHFAAYLFEATLSRAKVKNCLIADTGVCKIMLQSSRHMIYLSLFV